MKENNKIFKQIGAIALASTLLVSAFPRIQVTQAATTFSMTNKVTIGKGETFQLNTKGDSSKISYQSSNKKVVSITQSGKIKGKKVGKATITAKINKKTKKCRVTVKAAPKKISFSQKEITMLPGASKKLAISFSSGYSNKITYKAENSAVASISVNGYVTAKTTGETIITAKTFNGKTATIRCIVTNNSTPDTTNTAVSTTSPAITGTPQQTTGTTTNTPHVSNTPISSLKPTQAGSTLRPVLTDTPNTEETLKPTATPESSKIPYSEVPSTENPTAVPTPTAKVTTTPSTTVTATDTPSLEPTATTQTTVTSSAVISKIEDGTIYIDNDRIQLQLTSCITYYKTRFDGTLFDITKEELLPGDTIEITFSGLISKTYPVSILVDCDQIVVTDSIANDVVETEISKLTNELISSKNATFYHTSNTSIYKNGQNITVDQLKEGDIVRICALGPVGQGEWPAAIECSPGFIKTIVVLGDSVNTLQKDQAYFFYRDNYDSSTNKAIWNTDQGPYLITSDTLLEITQPDGSVQYQYATNQLPPMSAHMTIYYETLSDYIIDNTFAKKVVRVSYAKEESNYDNPYDIVEPKKPIIYLYPEEKVDVTVDLDFDGDLTYTYPYTENGHWEVTANTDGTLTNKADGLEYSYLFWEGATDKFTADFSKGFCVKGEDTTKFLQTILPKMGLTPKEYNEFIVYWAPQMQDNAYNLISFQSENYEQNAPLHINPAPDSMLRVYMAYKPLNSPVYIEPQTFEPFERQGFTVVEWGGCAITN